MTLCNLCHKEIKEELKNGYKRDIYIGYSCKAWQSERIDICDDCSTELKEILRQAESEFYQNKIKQLKEKNKNG
jgi:hypothetical protein